MEQTSLVRGGFTLSNMAKRTGKTEHELLCYVGMTIALKLSVNPEQIRYVSIVFHDGKRWTVSHEWQRGDSGQWMTVALEDWSEID